VDFFPLKTETMGVSQMRVPNNNTKADKSVIEYDWIVKPA
jgi:hypothetical protein